MDPCWWGCDGQGGDDLSARASLLVQKHTAEPAQWRLPAGLKWPRLARLYNCTLLCATSCVVLGLVVINLANSLVLGLPYPWLCLSPDTVFEYWERARPAPPRPAQARPRGRCGGLGNMFMTIDTMM